MTFIGNDSILKSLIPQGAWAVIKDHHQFFLQLLMKDDLDQETTLIAISELHETMTALCHLQAV